MTKMSDASKQKPGPKRKLSDSVRKGNRRELNAKNNTKNNIFRRIFSQQLLMAEIWYLVTSFI